MVVEVDLTHKTVTKYYTDTNTQKVDAKVSRTAPQFFESWAKKIL